MKISAFVIVLAAIICVSARAIPVDQADPQATANISSPSSSDPKTLAFGDEFKCFDVDTSNKISIARDGLCTLAQARDDALAFLNRHKESFPREAFRLAWNYIDLIPDFAEGKALEGYFKLMSDTLTTIANVMTTN